MKSAYELAMERLERDTGPSKKLTDEQKAQIAEIDNAYEARIAEQRLQYESKLSSATSMEEIESLRAEMADAIASLEAERDAKKDAIWNAS